MKKKSLAILLSLMLFFSLFCGTTVTAYAAWALPVNVDVLVDDHPNPYTLHGYTVEGYDFYLLKDIASILSDTGKPFDLTEGETVGFVRGESYHDQTHELLSQRPDVIDGGASFVTQSFQLETGRKVTYSVAKVDGEIFMRLADVLQILNVYGVYDDDEEAMILDTTKPFTTSHKVAVRNDYFDYLHGAVVGNGQGEILDSFHGNDKVAIASTTKIMTFLLVMEAIDEGLISWEDKVTITEEGARLSRTEDRVLRDLEIGTQIPLSQLMDAMLVVSSNEAATLLGEHVAGTEAKFVALMNKRAKELDLGNAEFHNSHGLPVYTTHVFSSKLQNRMTANELYQLAAYVLDHYPEILDITSKETILVKTTDESFTYTGSSTNRLMFQMENIDGLKTGTTNRSGACLVATMSLDPENADPAQRFIAVVLGAEDNMERYWKAGILLEYAKETYFAHLDETAVPLADMEEAEEVNDSEGDASSTDNDDLATPALEASEEINDNGDAVINGSDDAAINEEADIDPAPSTDPDHNTAPSTNTNRN